MLSRKEIKRQIFHLLLGLILAFLIYVGLINRLTMGLLLAAAYLVHIISKKKKIPGIYWFLDKFEREEDLIKNPGKGAFYYLAGSSVAVLLFPKDIAIASILILAIGDSISHLIGKFGSIKHPFSDKKFLEGFIAGVIMTFISSYVILGSAIEAALGSVTAMGIEGLDIRLKDQKIDDNLLIPVVAACVIWLTRFIVNFL